jgi:hypothetical protein
MCLVEQQVSGLNECADFSGRELSNLASLNVLMCLVEQ